MPTKKVTEKKVAGDSGKPLSKGSVRVKAAVLKTQAQVHGKSVGHVKQPAPVAKVEKAVKKVVTVKTTPAEREEFRDRLLKLRQHVVEQIESLQGDSLQRFDSENSGEDGTDAFDRQLALDLASCDHEALLKIDDALRRIEEGTYGVCEECSEIIGRLRLKALPFVNLCIACQAEAERHRTRPMRPGFTLQHQTPQESSGRLDLQDSSGSGNE